MPKKPPSYRQRKGYAQALVTLTDAVTKQRRDYWLGEHGSPQSRELYHQVLAEWEANGRRLPDPPNGTDGPAAGVTVAEVLNRYWRWSQTMYSASEVNTIAQIIKITRQLFGSTPAEAFGPKRLRMVRDAMIKGEPTFITWSADKLVMPTIPGPRNSPSSGSIITVAGLDSNIRGQQHTKMDGTIIRPSLVILDDPQTRQSAASPTQTKHRLAILNGDVLGMAGPDMKIAGFMTCTKIYHDDLADQILDREKNPEWQGECTKMVYAFPSDEKLWDRYAELRGEGLREGDGGKRATEFYREHRTEMDVGTTVAWPDRYNDDELSAIQHAINLKLRDEEAFFAEYQNEPLTDQADEDVLTPDQVASRFNGRPRKVVPQAATCLTMFIDVHDKLLFYAVCAWEPDFTGYVIDYGAYPDQKRRFFTLRDATRTLTSVGSGAGVAGVPGVEGAIQAGIESLTADYLTHAWQRTNTGALRIERCLIDSGYLPGVVANIGHRAPGNVAMPSKGVGIRAGNRPMSTYRRKPGERHGHNWYVPNVSRTSEFPHVQYDTNYWKTFVHARLAEAPGDRGCLTLFGKSESEHRLFADHVAGSETWVRTTGHGRTVQEWTLRPSHPDNHWFDCLVGCAVAASMCGVRIGIEKVDRPARPRIRLSDLQQRGATHA